MGRPALIVGDSLDVSQSLTPNDPVSVWQVGRRKAIEQRWRSRASVGAAVHALEMSLPMGAFHGTFTTISILAA